MVTKFSKTYSYIKKHNLSVGQASPIQNGESVIFSTSSNYITKNQIEAARKVLVRFFRNFSPRPILQICISYKIPVTKKSNGSRMGKGKGAIVNYISKVPSYTALFKIQNLSDVATSAIVQKVGLKLPVTVAYRFGSKKWSM